MPRIALAAASKRIGSPGGQPRLDQVLDHLLLAVDNNAPAGQLSEIHAVALAAESQKNPAVFKTFAVESFTHAGVLQELRGAFFEDACAHSALDVVAAATLEHHGIDACTMQEVRQEVVPRGRRR